jgi:hypothetical protein
MPATKKRKSTGNSAKSGSKYGSNIGKTSKRTNAIITMVVGAGVVIGGAYWWVNGQQTSALKSETEALAVEGNAALAQVQTTPNQGNGHLGVGEKKNYGEPYPTSGDHDSASVKPGFYARIMPATGLVHSLEHGNVVIYYDLPSDAVIDKLKALASLYSGSWDGIVVTRTQGLGQQLILAAWTKSLRLPVFDPAATAAFMDAYRGRGPENKVR